MGLFDWFSKPKSHVQLDDLIWLTLEAKLTGLVQVIEERLKEHDRLLVVAHFPSTLAAVYQVLQKANIEFERHKHQWDAHDVSSFTQEQTVLPIAILSECLPNSSRNGRQYPLDETLPNISIIVIERHLLSSYDDHVTHFAQNLPSRCCSQFLLSLDDPVMRIFSSDRVRSILGHLGMQKDESIKSRMVSRRIRYAQKKMDDRMQIKPFAGPNPKTAEEWLERIKLE